MLSRVLAHGSTITRSFFFSILDAFEMSSSAALKRGPFSSYRRNIREDKSYWGTIRHRPIG